MKEKVAMKFLKDIESQKKNNWDDYSTWFWTHKIYYRGYDLYTKTFL